MKCEQFIMNYDIKLSKLSYGWVGRQNENDNDNQQDVALGRGWAFVCRLQLYSVYRLHSFLFVVDILFCVATHCLITELFNWIGFFVFRADMTQSMRQASNSTAIGITIVAVVLILSPIIICLVRNATSTIQVHFDF